MPPRTAIYARGVSFDEYGPSATQRQVERLRAYAEERGWAVAPEDIYRDEGASGLRRERLGLDRLLTAIVLGDIEVLVVDSPDRLARNELVLNEVLSACDGAGCQVIFIKRS